MPICAWTALLLGVVGVTTAQASSTLVTFSVDEGPNISNGTFNPPPPAGTGTDVVYARGTFNNWGAYIPLVQAGNSTIWTNTVNDTNDANGGNLSYIFHDTQNGDEGPADWANRAAILPVTSGASLVLPTPYFNDMGPATSANVKFQVDMSQEIELGHFHPQSGDTVVIAGSFQGWSINGGSQWVLTNDPSIMVTNNNFNPPVVESNVYTVTATIAANARYSGIAAPNCAENFKFVEMPGGNWDSPAYPNSDSGGNRFFAEYDQVLPLVSFNDTPYTPLAQVTLNVDMSGVIGSDPNYIPNSVVVWGTFNSWATGVPMTNNPAPNTNIFSTVLTMGEGASVLYQIRYTNSAINDFVYDFSKDEVYNNDARRTITLPITPTLLVTNLPVIDFNDLAVEDYLPSPTAVLFTVDMNGAVGTDAHVFNPDTDGVYINGSFVNQGYPQAWYAWSGGSNPVQAPPGYQMIRVGSTTFFTNTIIMPAGTPVPLSYQYGMDPDNFNGGPLQDEASGINHFRVVRSTVSNSYTMPVDTFTNLPYQEPFFSKANIWGVGSLAGGNLAVGVPVAGKVPVSWLGQPGGTLQVSSSLAGPWQNLPETAGAIWSAGYSSANGLVSVTNWPAPGDAFFRLAKP